MGDPKPTVGSNHGTVISSATIHHYYNINCNVMPTTLPRAGPPLPRLSIDIPSTQSPTVHVSAPSPTRSQFTFSSELSQRRSAPSTPFSPEGQSPQFGSDWSASSYTSAESFVPIIESLSARNRSNSFLIRNNDGEEHFEETEIDGKAEIESVSF